MILLVDEVVVIDFPLAFFLYFYNYLSKDFFYFFHNYYLVRYLNNT